MKTPKDQTVQESGVSGGTSWIADELLGIRTLEQRLSRKLKSGRTPDKEYLLTHIQDLNWRVELLDRALDEYVGLEAHAGGRASLHE